MTLCYFTGQHEAADEAHGDGGTRERFATTTALIAGDNRAVCEDHTEPFNPHGDKTANGVLIVPGLRVIDYNRRPGTVVRDRDASRGACEAVNPDVASYHPCHNGWTVPTHWYDVKGDDVGGGGMFDATRMKALR